MKLAITGGTGFIGSAVVEHFSSAGHTVVLLRRGGDESWAAEIDGADAVIHLAGEPIAARRWSAEQKQRIAQSRILGTRAIVDAIASATRRPRVLINASAVGFYGNIESGDVTETHPGGSGFLPDTCRQWEEEAAAAEKLGVRVVRLRIGVVLGKKGGALQKMLLPFKLFIGGPLGSGRQWFPWIHREDVVGAVQFVLDHEDISGPVNITAPEPVTMAEFCKVFGRAIHRPSWAPVPAFALKLLIGEMSCLMLEGARAIPKKLLDAGFRFKYPKIDMALNGILQN